MAVVPERDQRLATDGPPESTARASGGTQMIVIFVGAALAVTLAVTVLAITDRWWVLVPVMLFDVAATFGVSVMTALLLADDGEQQRPPDDADQDQDASPR